MPVIYKITNPTGKVYIGQSWSFKKREEVYRNGRCKLQPVIYSSIKKYGWGSHSISIVCELPEDVSQDVLNIYEDLYHQQFTDCGVKTMNVRKTGSRGKLSEESKRKISVAKKGTKLSQEVKDKISKGNTGRVVTQETRDKIASKHKGRKVSPETLLKFKRPKSEKAKLSMSKVRKGKKLIEIFGADNVDSILQNRSKGLTGTHLKPIMCIETGVHYKSVKEAAELTGVSRTSITNILIGLTKKSRKGFSFTYIHKTK